MAVWAQNGVPYPSMEGPNPVNALGFRHWDTLAWLVSGTHLVGDQICEAASLWLHHDIRFQESEQ